MPCGVVGKVIINAGDLAYRSKDGIAVVSLTLLGPRPPHRAQVMRWASLHPDAGWDLGSWRLVSAGHRLANEAADPSANVGAQAGLLNSVLVPA
jgi:hypothetical protein